MTRLNIVLLLLVIFSAVGVVASQHQSRKLFVELQQYQDMQKQYEIEWGQLQLEQSTWAMHSRIEQIASHERKMQVPDPARVQMVVRP